MQNDGEALEYALRAGRALENLLQKEAAAARKFKEALDGLDSRIRDQELTERLYDALNELINKNKTLEQLLAHDITLGREEPQKTPKFAQEQPEADLGKEPLKAPKFARNAPESDLDREIRKTKEKIKTMTRDKSKPFDLDRAMEKAKLECQLDKLLAKKDLALNPEKAIKKVVEHDLVR